MCVLSWIPAPTNQPVQAVDVEVESLGMPVGVQRGKGVLSDSWSGQQQPYARTQPVQVRCAVAGMAEA